MPRTAEFNPSALRSAPKTVRGPLTTGLAKAAKRIDLSDDGKHTILRDVSLITRGEAGGHGKWIDSDFLDQTAGALSATERGVKARFTHPGLSADGLGNWLGRVKASKGHQGDKVLGDMWISQNAQLGPNFDGESIGDYLADRAEEDPQSMGLSIVFFRDFAAELDLLLENGGKLHGYDRSEVNHIPPERLAEYYEVLDLSEFVSPDPDNTDNLIHFRLKQLRAADLVDEPAANPDGMFSSDSNQFAEAADAALAYALGLSDDYAESDLLPVHPERLRAFATRFFTNRGLDPTEFFAMNLPPKPPAKTGQDFLDAFGDEGAMFYAKGLSFEEATSRFNAGLKEKIESLQKSNAELTEQLGKLTEFEETVKTLTTERDELSAKVDELTTANEELTAKVGVVRGKLGEKTPAGDGNPGGGKGGPTHQSRQEAIKGLCRMPSRN